MNNVNTLWEVHRAICYDIPEIFFINKVKASIDAVLGVITVYPEYRFDEEQRANILTQMEAATEMFTRRIMMLSEQEKLKQIHDYLAQTVTYKDVEAPYSHEAPGTILYGIGVCSGISKAFKYISDRVGIKSIVATGNTSGTDENTGHAWNVVFIDEQPYHIDVTFDYSASTDGLIRYDYYLLSDMQIMVDHTFCGLPKCGIDTEYYEQIGCFAKNKNALRSLVINKLRPEKPLVFKMPLLSGDQDQIVETIMRIVSAAVPFPFSFGRSILLSYNLERMIFQVQLQSED